MADLPGNTTTTATFQGDVQNVASYSGTFERPGDSDWIRLDLIAGTTYRIFARDELAGGASGDAYLGLFDAAGVELAGDDNSGSGQNAYLSFTATRSGTYFVGVNDVDNAVAQYTIDVVSSNFGGMVIVDGETIDIGSTGERFTSGSAADDRIYYDYQLDLYGDVIFGGAGDDEIHAGFPGTDPHSGGYDGPNTVYGGDGADTIYGGYKGDTLYGGGGNDTIHGSLYDCVLWGDAGDDTLRGAAGDDVLRGGTGADAMAGNAGNDTYHVDNIGDIVDETGSFPSGLDKVYASISFSLVESATVRGKVENLVLVGSRALDGTGNAVANQIFGNTGANALSGLAGNDSLDGRGGNDILVGGAGADRLTGGLGADRFTFTAVSDSTTASRDVILDFSRAEGDRIDLKQIDANSATIGNQAFKFLGTGAFTHHAGELRYATQSGSVFVYGDVNGDGTADVSVKVEGVASLQATDFIL